MTDFARIIKDLNDKKDFLIFLELLIDDLEHNPHEWENNHLESYLEAIGRWTEEMDGYYQNTGQPLPDKISWKVFADILVAAKMYE